MAAESRSIEALLSAGRPMTGVSSTTSLLLGLAEPAASTKPDVPAQQDADDHEDRDASAGESGAPHVPEDSASRPSPTEDQNTDEPLVGKKTRPAVQVSSGALDMVIGLLPAEHEVLRSGARRDDLPVRDVTYETPSFAYFAFGRLKNDLARLTQRRITAPALVEAAFRCVPEDVAAVEEAISSRSIQAALRQGTQRRLSVRVSDERYRWLQDLTYLLYERSGERVPGAVVLTLAISLVLETAGRPVVELSMLQGPVGDLR